MSELNRAALAYARHGWPVAPLHSITNGRCSCGRVRCDSPGKHPMTRAGLKDASTDPATVEAWWSATPGANIGICSGIAAGIVAIDVDPRHGGDESLAELAREHGELPATVESLTGGGGRHLIFKHPGGTVRNRSNMRPGIDVRGDGGYIVAPPSNHASGGHYRWREGHGPDETTPAEMPEWLLAMATRQHEVAPAERATPETDDDRARRALATMRQLRADDRNDGSRRLYAAACIAVKNGLGDAQAVGVLRQYLAEAPAPRGYSDDDILRRVRDARRDTPAVIEGEADEPEPGEPIPEHRQFPTDALPDPVRGVVEHVARCTGTDPSWAGLAALVIAAGAIGGRVAALVKKGWSEPSVLWGAMIGPSGSLKSPVLRLMASPLHVIYRRDQLNFQDELDRHRQAKAAYELALAAWKRDSKNGKSTESDKPEPPVGPRCRRLLISDTTVEKLAAMLDDEPLGLIVVRDELAGWLGSFDRYAATRGGDRAAWLGFHDAAPIVVDRKLGGSIFVEKGHVSILGGIQPGIAARCFGEAELASGLPARILFAMPPERAAVFSDDELPNDAAAAWLACIDGLRSLEPRRDENGHISPRYLPLHRDAIEPFRTWFNENAQAVAGCGDDALKAALAKLRGQCIRLGLVMSAIEAVATRDRVRNIGPQAMARAIRLADWFAHEARRVYATLRGRHEADERGRLVEWIRARGGAATPRQAARGVRRFGGSVEHARAAMEALVAAGLGRWEKRAAGQAGGRPSELLVLTRADETPEGRAENPAGDGKNADSGGFVGASTRQ